MEMLFFLATRNAPWNGGSAVQIIPLLEKMLHDDTLPRSLHHAIIRTLMSPCMGSQGKTLFACLNATGMDCLISIASSLGHGEFVQDILTLLANEPHVQRVAIVPSIVVVSS